MPSKWHSVRWSMPILWLAQSCSEGSPRAAAGYELMVATGSTDGTANVNGQHMMQQPQQAMHGRIMMQQAPPFPPPWTPHMPLQQAGSTPPSLQPPGSPQMRNQLGAQCHVAIEGCTARSRLFDSQPIAGTCTGSCSAQEWSINLCYLLGRKRCLWIWLPGPKRHL